MLVPEALKVFERVNTERSHPLSQIGTNHPEPGAMQFMP